MIQEWTREQWESGDDLPLCLTVRETAAALRCDPKTVYKLIEQGDLPKVIHHNPVRVPTVAVRKALGFEPSTSSQ